MNMSLPSLTNDSTDFERDIVDLLAQMTLAEKIGQMCQLNAGDD